MNTYVVVVGSEVQLEIPQNASTRDQRMRVIE